MEGLETTDLTPNEQTLIKSILERLRTKFAGETVEVWAIHLMNAPGGPYLWIQATCTGGETPSSWQTRSPIRRALVVDGAVDRIAEAKADFIAADWRTAQGPGRGQS
jgi:hypothetical protein